jgi:anti-sigma-K factor RskA
VDTRAGLVTVRSVGAETPADHSLELWYIAAAGGTPRSLGLVDQKRRQAVLPAAARTGDLAGATLAVSVEPPGGSKTGAPTGPVIYSGKLIQD